MPTEIYLGLDQTSTMELFLRKRLLVLKHSIINAWWGPINAFQLVASGLNLKNLPQKTKTSKYLGFQ